MNRIILGESEITETIQRIAMEISAENGSMEDVVVVGIRTGGAYLAARLREALAGLTGARPPGGVLDITLYRDDWTRIAPAPIIGKTELPFSVDNKIVILVDDVLFTGRTVRAAMDALTDLGRPSMIQLGVLIDRGHRELPIRADYAGRIISTSRQENVEVIFDDDNVPLKVILKEMSEKN